MMAGRSVESLLNDHDVLEIGPGRPKSGRITMDRDRSAFPNIRHDIRDPWPLPDAAVSRVIGEHVLEHVSHPTLASTVMPELARVLKPGGTAVIRVPLGVDARTDPTHASVWQYRTPLAYSIDAESWQPGQTESIPLRVVDRDVRLWGHRPLHHLSPLLDRLAGRYPEMMQDAPGCSGELTVRYRRVRDA